MKVYDVLPFSMNGQVRHPCFEPQRNVPAGSLGVLLVLASLARTSGSRRLGERLSTPEIPQNRTSAVNLRVVWTSAFKGYITYLGPDLGSGVRS